MGEHTIWTEKYRPKDFAEIRGQREIIEKVQAMVKQKNLPHMLFAGPAGVGKTTLALVVARKLFGENWRQNVLELNASDERGIDVIRHQVKDFARTKAIGDVPFKLIYLDECDALTREAQQALRRTMENFTQTTRFILSCVTPETKILLPGEREIMVKEFIDQYEHGANQIHVQNISPKRDATKKDIVLVAVQLPPTAIGKKVLEITTVSGRRIKVTDDHKLLTTSGWKEAGEITQKDKLLIYPNLEGTPVEGNPNRVIDIIAFVQFLSRTEEQDGLETIETASSFGKLRSREKERILQKIGALRKVIEENKGLTEREFQLYKLIKENGEISRDVLQKTLGITRMGTNYLLTNVEKKSHIKRIINKKNHLFVVSGSEPIVLRNDMDIRRAIEKEFNVKMSYTAVKKSRDATIAHGRIDRVLGELKRKDLLDITYNDIEKIGALARICGFMLGDGHLVRNDVRLHFSGNREALEEVKKDLDILGYLNYSRIQSVSRQNIIRGRWFVGTSTSFTLDAKPLSLLLQYLGIVKGDKTITPFGVPKFVKNGTKYVKREFLRALFGCDADKPKYKKMNFASLSLRLNKAKGCEEGMLRYYGELSRLLDVFDIDSYVKIRDKGEVRKRDKVAVLTFDLVIRPNNKNLFKFFSRISYAYEAYKIRLARISAEYLRHKLHLIELWQKKSNLIIAAVNEERGIFRTARKFAVTPDFVTNQMKGKIVHLPRNQFMSVDRWVQEYVFNGLLLINDIHEIKEVKEPMVMDITCQNDHNFVTNGFISHNCNYSSKIIDPIQSRCAVFRFKPLAKEELMDIVDTIAHKEGLKLDAKAKDALYEVTEGDCRRAENILQSCTSMGKTITEDLIFSMASAAKPAEVLKILELAAGNKFVEARDLLLKTMLTYGLSGLDLVKQIQKTLLELKLDGRRKLELIAACGEAEFRMTEGSDEFLQLEAFLARVALAGS